MNSFEHMAKEIEKLTAATKTLTQSAKHPRISTPYPHATPPTSPVRAKKQITPEFDRALKQQREDRLNKATQKKTVKAARNIKFDLMA